MFYSVDFVGCVGFTLFPTVGENYWWCWSGWLCCLKHRLSGWLRHLPSRWPRKQEAFELCTPPFKAEGEGGERSEKHEVSEYENKISK